MSALIWLPEAVADLERLIKFLQDKNPTAAVNVARLIHEGAKLLKSQPRIGRSMEDREDESNRRELYLPFGSSAYVLRYRLDGETIVIIRVWHGRELRK